MRPSFEQFVAALREPPLRAGIGLVIEDLDAASLLSRDDWASDYYQKWIAMFPAEPVAVAPEPVAAEPVAAEPVTAEPVAAEPVFVAPELAAVPVAAVPPAPSYLSSPPPSYVPVANRVPGPAFAADPLYPPTAVAPAGAYRVAQPRQAKLMRTPFIVAGGVVALIILAGAGISLYQSTLHAVNASHQGPSITTAPRSTPSASAEADAPDSAPTAGKYGLTSQEYELMEAASAPYGHTLEDAVAAGATEAQLRSQADAFEGQISKTCETAASLPGSWQNAAFESWFESGFEATSKATPAQAARVYLALEKYCRGS